MAEKTMTERLTFLTEKAKEVRLQILAMIHNAQSGHPGGSLSAAEVMTALYFDIMNIDPANPDWEERDRFVLSKGHACPVWYTVLALRGYFPLDTLSTLREFGSPLQGHPVQGKCPGIDATTGSLGIGVCEAVGMALNAKLAGRKNSVFAVLGDGETNEGAVWEAAGMAQKHKLNNFVIIVDNNRVQNDGFGTDIMPMEPIDEKFKSFNWHVERISGDRMEEVLPALERAVAWQEGPVCIVADGKKGRGVSFMELDRAWHGKPPNDEQYEQAVKEVKEGLKWE